MPAATQRLVQTNQRIQFIGLRRCGAVFRRQSRAFAIQRALEIHQAAAIHLLRKLRGARGSRRRLASCLQAGLRGGLLGQRIFDLFQRGQNGFFIIDQGLFRAGILGGNAGADAAAIEQGGGKVGRQRSGDIRAAAQSTG